MSLLVVNEKLGAYVEHGKVYDLPDIETGQKIPNGAKALFASLVPLGATNVIPTTGQFGWNVITWNSEDGEAWSIDKVAQVTCDHCTSLYASWKNSIPVKTTPIKHSDGEQWLYPCHQQECAECDNIIDTTADEYEYNGNNLVCTDCYVEPEPDDEDRCDCDECTSNRRRDNDPSLPQARWCLDDLSIDIDQARAGDKWAQRIASETEKLNVGHLMAEFYLCDFVMMTAYNAMCPVTPYVIDGEIQTSIGTPYRGDGAWKIALDNGSHKRDDMAKLWDDAKRYQDHIVALLDPIFRDYLLLACGGELRHYYGIHEMPTGRDSSWNWFLGMALVHGREYMAQSALDMFAVKGGWNSGFGGQKWADIATVSVARENGTLDARAFVDRVFSLQHNGGSALNKLAWHGLQHIIAIGDAHAANTPKLATLMKRARPEFVSDLFLKVNGDSFTLRLSGNSVHPDYSDAYNRAIHYAARQMGFDTSETHWHCVKNCYSTHNVAYVQEKNCAVHAYPSEWQNPETEAYEYHPLFDISLYSGWYNNATYYDS